MKLVRQGSLLHQSRPFPFVRSGASHYVVAMVFCPLRTESAEARWSRRRCGRHLTSNPPSGSLMSTMASCANLEEQSSIATMDVHRRFYPGSTLKRGHTVTPSPRAADIPLQLLATVYLALTLHATCYGELGTSFDELSVSTDREEARTVRLSLLIVPRNRIR